MTRIEKLIKELEPEEIRAIALYYARQKRTTNIDIAKDITIFVEDLMGIDDIMKKSRKQEYVMARWLYYYALKELTSLSLEDIGHPYDHSTVIHALKQIDIIQKFDKGWRNDKLRKVIVFIKKKQLI